ncbi:hypothetical protein EV401DRAFT_596563 [Pisolithus croceorrhizus]|nr:hypothetical protein EV401DRAFT_596563 [Pisolithus croceorrhizus]
MFSLRSVTEDCFVTCDLGEAEDFPGRVTSRLSHTQLRSASYPTSRSTTSIFSRIAGCIRRQHFGSFPATHMSSMWRLRVTKFVQLRKYFVRVRSVRNFNDFAYGVGNNSLPPWFFVTPNIKETRSTILLILLGGAVPSNLKGTINNYVHYLAFASALRNVARSNDPHLQSPPLKATECSITSDDMTATQLSLARNNDLFVAFLILL